MTVADGCELIFAILVIFYHSTVLSHALHLGVAFVLGKPWLGLNFQLRYLEHCYIFAPEQLRAPQFKLVRTIVFCFCCLLLLSLEYVMLDFAEHRA